MIREESAELVDREAEAEALRHLAEEKGPRLALLYGRRRVGKTYLLDHLWGGDHVFYFLAADSTPGMNRGDLVRDLADWSGRELEPGDFPSWRGVFRLIIDLARDEALIVVLDEFQYLLGGDDDAASQLVAVWDREVRDLPLTMVLCGSEVSTMEQLRGADQPLYGRFDWSHRLRPFDYLDARSMVPDRSIREAVAVYGIFGGLPQYLAAIRPGESLEEAVSRTMLAPGGSVRVQLENVIEQEKGIRKPARYRAVLAAVARGRTRRNEIATGAGLEDRPETVRDVLRRLEDLELIWAVRNFDAPANAPLRYRVADNAVRFWYRFVDPHRSHLETGAAEDVWRQKVVPDLDSYLGKVFERICREAFERSHDRWGLSGAEEWSRWEGQDRSRRPVEIDVVARLLSGGMLTGEIKWSSRPVGPAVHQDLLRDLEALSTSGYGWAHQALPEGDEARYLYVSAAGFTEDFLSQAAKDERILLLDLEQLYVCKESPRSRGK